MRSAAVFSKPNRLFLSGSFRAALPHSFRAEAMAILLAVSALPVFSQAKVFSDCQGLVTLLASWLSNAPTHRQLLRSCCPHILGLILQVVKGRHLSISLEWVPSHSGIHYNEMADRIASSATHPILLKNCASPLFQLSLEDQPLDADPFSIIGKWSKCFYSAILSSGWRCDELNISLKSSLAVLFPKKGKAAYSKFTLRYGWKMAGRLIPPYRGDSIAPMCSTCNEPATALHVVTCPLSPFTMDWIKENWNGISKVWLSSAAHHLRYLPPHFAAVGMALNAPPNETQATTSGKLVVNHGLLLARMALRKKRAQALSL